MGHIMTGVDRVCLHSDVEVVQSLKSSMAFACLSSFNLIWHSVLTLIIRLLRS